MRLDVLLGAHLRALALAAAALSALAGCDAVAPGGGAGGASVAVSVAALDLPGVGDGVWDIEVLNGVASPEVVWRRRVTSTGYGDGSGSASYVGPCDADASPNTVRVWLVGLYGAPVAAPGGFAAGSAAGIADPPLDLQNPTTLGPLTRSVPCLANSDNAVGFDVTVARPAAQGFFDVAVAFNDIFCSAKLDCCTPAAGGGCEATELLFDATGQRSTTYVLGFACTAGTAADVATALLLDDLAFDCDINSGAGSFVADFTVDPSGAGGNQCTPGADGMSACLAVSDDPPAVDADAFLFQVAVFKGTEALTVPTGAAHKVYWNVALGVRAGISGCTLRTQGTADDAADDQDGVTAVGAGGQVAAGVVYPMVAWDVPLGSCAAEGLIFGVPGAPVSAVYTDVGAASPTTFAHRYEGAETRLAACTGLPADAHWNTADAITQTFGGGTWAPTTAGVLDATPSTTACHFVCDTNFVWSGSSCDALPNAPTLTTVFPDYGSVAGGDEIALLGTNFVDGAAVTFGALASPAVTFVSATRLDVEVPAGAGDGEVAVTVTNPDTGTASLVAGYTYGPPLSVIACAQTGTFAAAPGVSDQHVYATFTAGDCGGTLPTTDSASPTYPWRAVIRHAYVQTGLASAQANFGASGSSAGGWRIAGNVATAYDLQAVYVPYPSAIHCSKLFTPPGNVSSGGTTFVAGDCGGLLPSSDYVGVLSNNEANYGVVGFSVLDAGDVNGPGYTFISDSSTHGLGVYTKIMYVRRDEVIVCKRTGAPVSGASPVRVQFSAAHCGGALPTLQHVGALRTVIVGGGAYGYGVYDDATNGFGVWLLPKSTFSGTATVEAVYFLP